MQNFLQNLRFSFRVFRKNPGFTAIVIITLALGIGAVTAIYSVVYATLIADMPYPKPEQIVMVWSQIKGHRSLVSPADYLDWRSQSTIFQSLVGWRTGSMNLGDIDESEIVRSVLTTPGYYKSLGVKFAFGRDLLPDENVAGKDQVVVLNNHLWVRLGADPKIIGKTLQLNQKAAIEFTNSRNDTDGNVYPSSPSLFPGFGGGGPYLRVKFPEPQEWHNLASMREEYGWDKNGAMAAIDASFDPDKLELSLSVKGDLKAGPAYKDIDTDFWGHALSGERLPGPFGDLLTQTGPREVDPR